MIYVIEEGINGPMKIGSCINWAYTGVEGIHWGRIFNIDNCAPKN